MLQVGDDWKLWRRRDECRISVVDFAKVLLMFHLFVDLFLSGFFFFFFHLVERRRVSVHHSWSHLGARDFVRSQPLVLYKDRNERIGLKKVASSRVKPIMNYHVPDLERVVHIVAILSEVKVWGNFYLIIID